jgi:ribosome biogenesis GTPase A
MVQWYPGHMAKAKKEIEEKLKLVDIVFELVDARIPVSSQNPMISEILKSKQKLILITKANLADEKMTKRWQGHFKTQNIESLFIDSISGFNINKIISISKVVLQTKFEKEKSRGMKERAIRAMVIGIPNVGKSTLINRLVNKKVTNVGDKPGITKAQQWIRINKDLELLDTPGVLWPKFEDQRQGFHLAISGAIKDDVYHKDDMVIYLLDFLKKYYPKELQTRYDFDLSIDNFAILDKIANNRGFIKNNETDYEKTYEIILNDFRNCRIGRITLDRFNYD